MTPPHAHAAVRRVVLPAVVAMILALLLPTGGAAIAAPQPVRAACTADRDALDRARGGYGLDVLIRLVKECGGPLGASLPLPVSGRPDPASAFWPAGVNDDTCRYRPGGPAPVLLLPGMFVPGQALYWARLAPGLRAAGHCVFALELPGLDTAAPEIGAAAIIRKLAHIRSVTGAAAPAVLTYSVGAVYAREAIREGETAISTLLTVAGQNNGFSPVVSAAISLPGIRELLAIACPMCAAMTPGSPYLTSLAAANTARAVPTVTLSSRTDWASRPEDNALPGARNLILQDLCPTEQAGHLTAEWSTQVLVTAIAVLGGRPVPRAGAPQCGVSPPL